MRFITESGKIIEFLKAIDDSDGAFSSEFYRTIFFWKFEGEASVYPIDAFDEHEAIDILTKKFSKLYKVVQ